MAVSGLILTAGLSLVLWAVTPSSGTDVAVALRGGVVAFASANLMPVVIGGVALDLAPLLLTLAIATLLSSTARRGRFLPDGRYQETVSVLITAAVYGLVVAATTRAFGPADAVPAGWVWVPFTLAFLATTAGMLRSESAWHDWWTDVAPGWARLGVRGGGIGIGVLIAGGGIAVSVGLIGHFGSAVEVAATAAPSWMDGLGMAMLGLAYVPNAVIAGAGYLSGVGFEIGPGTYSPFATSTVDLPAVPLLAAAPDQSGRSVVGLAFLAVPVVAGYLLARPAIRHLDTRAERVLAAALGAVLTGAGLAALAGIARGGVGDGRWSTIGVPPLLLGAVIAAAVGVVAVTVAVITGSRTVPWRLDRPVAEPAARTVKAHRPGTRVRTDAADAVEDDDLTDQGPTDDDAPDDAAADLDAADDQPDGVEAAADERSPVPRITGA